LFFFFFCIQERLSGVAIKEHYIAFLFVTNHAVLPSAFLLTIQPPSSSPSTPLLVVQPPPCSPASPTVLAGMYGFLLLFLTCAG